MVSNALESRKAVTRRLRYLLIQSGRIALGPSLYAELFEVSAQRDQPPPMTWLRQDAFVR